MRDFHFKNFFHVKHILNEKFSNENELLVAIEKLFYVDCIRFCKKQNPVKLFFTFNLLPRARWFFRHSEDRWLQSSAGWSSMDRVLFLEVSSIIVLTHIVWITKIRFLMSVILRLQFQRYDFRRYNTYLS
jgi:hypothetical protein